MIFTESAHLADSVIESPCLPVWLSVCLRHWVHLGILCFIFLLHFFIYKKNVSCFATSPLSAAVKEKVLVLLLTLVDRFFVSRMRYSNCPLKSLTWLSFFPYFIALWRRMNQLCAYHQPHKYPKYLFAIILFILEDMLEKLYIKNRNT